MGYLGLNIYKKAIEMIQANCTQKFIRAELELDAKQYSECLKLYNLNVNQKLNGSTNTSKA